jgi:hypothetical protein
VVITCRTRTDPSRLFPWPERERGPSGTASEVSLAVKMVEPDPTVVERRLEAGDYTCPACGTGRLARWGHARSRALRDHGAAVRLRPRRSRCRSCLVTHVLLPTIALLRRRDLVEVIGEALTASILEHKSREEVRRRAGVPCHETVRGWLRRFKEKAEELRELFSTLAHELDESLGPITARASPSEDALEAIGLAASAAARRLGPSGPWRFAAGASGGRLLSNTNCLLP